MSARYVEVKPATYYKVVLQDYQLYKQHDDGDYTFRIAADSNHSNEVWLCDLPRNLVHHKDGQYEISGVFYQPVPVHMYAPVTAGNKDEVGLRTLHSFPDITGHDDGTKYYETNALVMLFLPWKELCEGGTFRSDFAEPVDYKEWAKWHGEEY